MRVAAVIWCPVEPVNTAGAVRMAALYPRLDRWEWRVAAPGPASAVLRSISLPRHWLSRLPWPWSPQVFNLWDHAGKALVTALHDWRPDAVVAEGAWSAWAARYLANACNAPLLVSALSIERLSTIGTGRGPLRRALAGWMETRALRLADLLACTTEHDRRILAAVPALAQKRIELIPQGTDTEALSRDSPNLRSVWGIAPEEKVVLFVGKLDYPPNASALRWLAKEIAPAVRTHRPQIRFVVAGAPVPPRPVSGLTFTGFVPDLTAALRTADVCVAPISAGTGIRTKILDYLAAGKPVVTTTVGDLGIGTEDGVHLLRRDTTTSFAQAILALLDDPKLARQLASAGQAFVTRRYDWRVIAQHMEFILDTLVASHRNH